MIDAAVAMYNGFDRFAACKRRQNKLICGRPVRESYLCFGVKVHSSLGLVRAAE
jgi:hypothetical protein